MAEVPTLEAAVQAVHVLNNDPNPANKAAANEWLTGFQESPHAWTVADAMLHAEGLPMQATFIAVQTLRSKMKRDFNELPPESQLALRDSVMAHLLKFKAGPQIMITQVALSLADFAVQCAQWIDTVPHIMGSLGDDPAAMPCLLEVIKVLPQEIDNEELNVHRGRRHDFAMQIGAHFRDISSFLCQCFEQCGGAGPMAHKIIECYTAWLNVCPHDVSMDEVATNPLIPVVFQALSNEEMFDAGVDCICYLLYMSRLDSSSDLAGILVPNVMGLRELQAQIFAAGEDAEEQARGITRIFVELGEAHMRFVQTATPDALQVCEAVLACGYHDSPKISKMPFDFWYTLSSECVKQHKNGNSQLKESFTPHFHRWMDSLIRLLNYPEDYDEQPPDKQDDFKKFRYAVADAVVDACLVIGADACLERFWGALQTLMATPNCSWQNVEAVLYGVRSMARHVSRDEKVYLPQIMTLIPDLPVHRPLQYTASLMVGACSEWLPQNPGFLATLFPYLVACLDDPALADAASLSVKNVCDTCANHFIDEATATSLMELYGKTETLEHQSAMELTQAISYVVSAMPLPMVAAAMPQMVNPLLARVQALAGQYTAGDRTKETKKSFSNALRRLSSIFQILDDQRSDGGDRADKVSFSVPEGQPHPCAAVMESIFGVIDQVMTACIDDASTMENACRVLKYLCTSMQLHAGPMLPMLAAKLVQCFQHRPHSCFLYCSATLVSVFGASPDESHQACVAGLLGAYAETVCTEAGLLSTVERFTEMPDVVEDFFDFAAKFYRSNPALLLHGHSEILASIFACGMRGLSLGHRDASKAVLLFFAKSFALGSDGQKYQAQLAENRAALQAIFGPFAEAFSVGLLAGVAGGLPHSRCREAGSIFYSLRVVFEGQMDAWFYSGIAALPAPPFTDELKQGYMAELTQAQTEDKFQDVMRKMKDVR